MDALQFPFEPRKKPNSPTMATTMPPISNQTALSVGDPVNNRDTSELNDSETLTPQMIDKIPPTNNATEMPLFISTLAILQGKHRHRHVQAPQRQLDTGKATVANQHPPPLIQPPAHQPNQL